jgi:hypothetical protein
MTHDDTLAEMRQTLELLRKNALVGRAARRPEGKG